MANIKITRDVNGFFNVVNGKRIVKDRIVGRRAAEDALEIARATDDAFVASLVEGVEPIAEDAFDDVDLFDILDAVG